jgi:hypothetical protein
LKVASIIKRLSKPRELTFYPPWASGKRGVNCPENEVLIVGNESLIIQEQGLCIDYGLEYGISTVKENRQLKKNHSINHKTDGFSVFLSQFS